MTTKTKTNSFDGITMHHMGTKVWHEEASWTTDMDKVESKYKDAGNAIYQLRIQMQHEAADLSLDVENLRTIATNVECEGCHGRALHLRVNASKLQRQAEGLLAKADALLNAGILLRDSMTLN
jgi:hypothetical protein